MATIVDMVRVMKQMEDAARAAYCFSDLNAQLAKAAEQAYRTPDIEAQIVRASAQFRTVDDVLQQARAQMLMRDELMARTRSHSALATPAFDASQSITKMLERFKIDRHIADITAHAAKDWTAITSASALSHQRALLPLEAHIARLYEFSAISEASLLRVRPEALGSRLRIGDRDREQLAARHDEFGGEFRAFFDGVSRDEATVLELPRSLTELPAAEFVNQAALVVSTSEAAVDVETEVAQREVSAELAEETSDHLTVLVSGMSPELVGLLQGARAAFDSRHPDYVRHFAVSLRELFTQVLHTLSPDELVDKWTKDPKHYHNRKPTRKARLLYITRDIAPLFGGFVNADVEAVLEFIDAFQKGTHGVSPNFSDEDVFTMRQRMEGLLRLLLVLRQTQ